ncbi:MAG: hypothetical protein ABSE51_13500 [Terracidiphilus sp.]
MKAHFPLVAVPAAKTNGNTSEADVSKPLVLLISDQPNAIQPLAEILPHCGFQILRVPDEKVALEIAAWVPPDLIIADGTRPGIKWLALAIAMKQAVPDCEVLLFSEPPWPHDLDESICLAGHSFATIA